MAKYSVCGLPSICSFWLLLWYKQVLKIHIYTEEGNLLEGHWHEVMKVLLGYCAWLRAACSAQNSRDRLVTLRVHLHWPEWDQSPLLGRKTQQREGLKGFSSLTTRITEEPGKTGGKWRTHQGAQLAHSNVRLAFFFSLPFRWAVFYVYFLSQCLCTTWIALQVCWSCKVGN